MVLPHFSDTVQIQLDQGVYFVEEASGVLQVCVQVQGENVTLERPVSVNISTMDDTAIGMHG